MDISFSYFWQQMTSNPALCITTLLTLGGNFCKWMDGRAECDRDLRYNQMSGGA